MSKLPSMFALYHDMVTKLAPGSRIPEVVVPFELCNIQLTNDESKKLQLEDLSAQILAHNKKYECYGLKYIPNAISQKEEVELIEHTIDYMKLHSSKVEEEHLIQRSDVASLDPKHPSIKRMRRVLAKNCNVSLRDVGISANFNYFPFATTQLHAHHDNLFLADQISVVTAGYSGSLRSVTFRHWVTDHEFTIFVEPRSMYIMDNESRYDYTHGGKASHLTPEDSEKKHIQNIVDECKAQRFSYVLGIVRRNDDFEINESEAQIWGESDQRKIVDVGFNGRFDLLTYIELVHILTAKCNYYTLLARHLTILKNKYISKLANKEGSLKI